MRLESVGSSARPALAAALVAVTFLVACTTPFGAAPGIHVVNIDGPAIRVIPWSGAPSVIVACGSRTDVPRQGAPPFPWDFRIYDAKTDREMFSKSLDSGTLYVIVRSGGVLWGTEPGSGGPAPSGACQ